MQLPKKWQTSKQPADNTLNTAWNETRVKSINRWEKGQWKPLLPSSNYNPTSSSVSMAVPYGV